MLASSANIPDNIKWANTTANTWALRAASYLPTPTNWNSRQLRLPSAIWEEDSLFSWHPSDQRLLLIMCFRPIFGLPRPVTKCLLLNQDLKKIKIIIITHASNPNTSARPRGDFVLWHGLVLHTERASLTNSDYLKLFPSSVQTRPFSLNLW